MKARRASLVTRLRILAAVGVVVSSATVGVPPAAAQSPVPNVYFMDWKPGSTGNTTNGLIVEGLGMGRCAYSLEAVQNATVTDINRGQATITEISPQNYCIPAGNQHIGYYENWIKSIIDYVEAHAPQAYRLWGGIMLDEEPNWGLDLLHLRSLNAWVSNQMAQTPGISWWYTELGNWPGSGWSQSDYNSLTCPTSACGWASPQVYNSNQANYANATGLDYQLVTCNFKGAYPWNSASYTAAQVRGHPYNERFGTSHDFQWENLWQPQ